MILADTNIFIDFWNNPTKELTEIFAKEDVDGGLIGGAALKADDFISIIKSI